MVSSIGSEIKVMYINITRTERTPLPKLKEERIRMETILKKRWENGKWGLLNIGIYMTAEERTAAFEKEAAKYCTQNNQNCETCSLVNYGLDCHNNKL